MAITKMAIASSDPRILLSIGNDSAKLFKILTTNFPNTDILTVLPEMNQFLTGNTYPLGSGGTRDFAFIIGKLAGVAPNIEIPYIVHISSVFLNLRVLTVGGFIFYAQQDGPTSFNINVLGTALLPQATLLWD